MNSPIPPTMDETGPLGFSSEDSELELDPRSDDDAEFLPRPPFRLAGSSLALIGCIAIGAGFLGGVLSQRHHDSGITRTGNGATRAGLTGGTGAARFAGGEGFGAGGFGGAAGAGGTGAGATGTGTGTGGSGTAGSGTSSTAIPSLIGTVASAGPSLAIVTNLGGAKVTVHLGKTTKLTAPYGTSTLTKGESVSVFGTKAADGTITATAVTVT
jgi:hypothetical protein